MGSKIKYDGGPPPRVTDNLVLFWGSWPSNWTIAPMQIDGQEYNSVEQWMMSEKARLFGDEATRRKILRTPHPMSQKKLGRDVRGYDDRKWKRARFPVVLRGTVEKYAQHPSLEKLILGTGYRLFVEASPDDDVWGIGLGIDDPRALTPTEWLGENLLGQCITTARSVLRAREA